MIRKGIKKLGESRRLKRMLIAAIAALSVFNVFLYLLSRSDVQTYLTGKITAYIYKQSGVSIFVGSVDYKFPLQIVLKDVRVKDLNNHPMVDAGHLRVRLSLRKLLFRKIEITGLYLDNVKIVLRRSKGQEYFNYQMLTGSRKISGTTDEKSSGNLQLRMPRAEIHHLYFLLTDEQKHMEFKTSFEKLDLNNLYINQAERKIKLSDLKLVEADISYRDIFTTECEPEKLPRGIQVFNKDGWLIEADQLSVEASSFAYLNENRAPFDGGMNYNDLYVSSIHIDLRNGCIEGDTISGTIECLSAREKCGFAIKTMAADARVSTTGIECKNLLLITDNSVISDYLHFTYESFADFRDYVNKVHMEGNFKQSRVSLLDINYFAMNALKRIAHNFVELTGVVRGTVSNLKGKDLQLAVGNTTRFKGNISMKGLPQFRETFISLDIEDIQTTAVDLKRFYPYFTYPQNLDQLGVVHFSGAFNGFSYDFVADGKMHTAIGDVSSDLNFKFNPMDNTARYSGNLATHDFNLGKYFNLPELLGDLTFRAHVKGSGLTLGTIEAAVDGNIERINIRQHNYRDAVINGQFNDRFFKGQLTIRDEDLDLDFAGTVDLQIDTMPVFQFNANLRRADLLALNLSDDSITVSSLLDIDFKGMTLDHFIGYAGLFNSRIEKNGELFTLDSFMLSALPLNATEKFIRLRTDVANGSLTGAFKYQKLPAAFKKLISFYFNPDDPIAEDPGEQNFTFDIQIFDTRNLTRLLHPALHNITHADFVGSFSSTENLVTLDGTAQKIDYGNFSLKNLSADVYSGSGFVEVVSKVDTALYLDSLTLEDIILKARIQPDSILFAFQVMPETAPSRVRLEGLLQTDFSSVSVEFFPSTVFVEHQPWHIQRDNHIYYDGNKLIIDSLELSNHHGLIRLTSFLDAYGQNHLAVALRNFDVGMVLNPFLASSKINLDARLNGTITVLHLMTEPTLLGSVFADTLRINEHFMGGLVISSSYRPEQKSIELNAGLRDAANSIQIEGNYFLKKKYNNLDFSINVQNLHLPHLVPFIQSEVAQLEGDVKGELKLTGELSAPVITGRLTASDVAAKINVLNTTYGFKQEELLFEPHKIRLENVDLVDEEQNTALANGEITYTSLADLNLNINITTRKFVFMNTPQMVGSPFYGKLVGRGEVSIMGPVRKNVLFRIRARTLDPTHVTVDVTETKDVSSYSFYRFINTNQTNETKYRTRLKKVTLDCDVEATTDATVNLMIDREDGDVIKGQGTGALKITLNNLGELFIAGNYRIESGNYLFSMQNVISKRFIIEKGSSINWSGDPTNAMLDIAALYKLRASPYDLLDDIVLSEEEKLKAKNRVQVLLYLYITGSLAQPEIRFDIKVPDADPAIRAALDSRFQQLKYNQDAMNLQVVGLLVLNRFLPVRPGIGNTDVASEVNNSVSEFLSNQLSILLSDWISEFVTELQVDINYRTYQTEINGNGSSDPSQIDFQSRQELQLALTKSFFNNRVSVDIGGNFDFGAESASGNSNASNIAGDFEIEYSITPDGRVKIKAFRKGEYDIFSNRNKNKTGVGISFQKEFNSPRDLFPGIRRAMERRGQKNKQEVTPSGNQP